MADDPRSLLVARQKSLRTRLDAFIATAPDDPHWAKISDELHGEVEALLKTRRDIDADRFLLLNRVLGAAAAVAAIVVLVLWFSAWNVVPALLALAVGAALLINPAVRGDGEPSARGWAGIAAVLGAASTPLLSGWAALVVLAGIGWWIWRCLK
ncbi:hypothetical protein [Lentzea flaviverrucosa]|uniref:Uncharacterized protein n=1 Tax=Lentzea flaviverrucosa TaxID=200379 RepID=A0A1H9GLT6_9PSEU|nr:hypothetical protein [Lentzea flaviverrucosa]RDI34865.1 hypothetical protein DFR72_101614 [Lentzea flaviverrucosa]SEQ51092.1 hypothetical protein SAMN05216195_102603 [Lentzea flaviverrucosa]